MMNALRSYDSYGDFTIKLFFANLYNADASKIAVYLDVEESRENFQHALDLIDLATYDLVRHSCRWTKSKNKDETEEDYVYFAIYRAANAPLCFEIELNNDELSMECYYDCRRPELEEWAIRQVDRIRENFGTTKSPEFYVLTTKKDDFRTTKIKINPVEFDLARHYNDTFGAVNATIESAFTEDRSGMILLYGQPGTGKTTYIKHLVQTYRKNKFIFVPNDFVKDLLRPGFISFLVRQVNSVIVIEDAEKVLLDRTGHADSSVVSTLLQLSDGLFSDYLKTKVICTFNTKASKIDKALFRKGRMIASYAFEALTPDKVQALLQAKAATNVEPMTLGEVMNAKEKQFGMMPERKIGFVKG